MAIYRGPGGTGDSTANASGDAAISSTAAANAAASAASAALSATSAGVDANTAQNAANNAANSQTAAATSAGNAATSAGAASTSATAALTSQTAAALSETNTATLYDNFDDRYLGVKSTSPAIDNDGNTLQTGALYFNSTTHDMFVWNGSLWTTVSNTTNSTAAATSATAALASQTAAATSATNAATSATSASNSASTATTQATNASNSASSASTSATNAANSASSASTSASTATTQASNASTSATNAASSASSASTSATNASSSATSAASSATSAAASYDSFDDRYLGAKSSAPTLDNDGNALLTGAIYWNTTTNSLWVWSGSVWDPAAFSAVGTVVSFNTRVGAVSLTSGDVTSALTYTPVAPNSSPTFATITDSALTAGRVTFAGTAGLLSDNANLFWDNTNNRLGIGTSSPTQLLDVNGNLAITGAARRMTGDFSNTTTIANRVMFQTSITDGSTRVSSIPNGTNTTTSFDAYNASDPTNASFARLVVTNTSVGIQSGSQGSGTFLPLTFNTNGSERVRIDTSGNVGIGTSSPSNKLTVNGGIELTGSAFSGSGVGLWQQATNVLGFVTAGSTRAVIDASGNMGIGTTSPIGKLTVYTGSGPNNLHCLNAGTTGSDTSSVIAQSSYGTSNYVASLVTRGDGISLISSNSPVLYIGNTSNNPALFITNNTEKMRIDSAGNVGIGTSSPSGMLDVDGALGAKYVNFSATQAGSSMVFSLLGGSASEQAICYNSVALRFGTVTGKNAAGFTERMRIDSNGNVGIGNSNPNFPLSVNNNSAANNFLASFTNTDTGSSSGSAITINQGVVTAQIQAYGNNTVYIGSQTNHPLVFQTNSLERIRIDTNGNLGIGVTPTGLDLLELKAGTATVAPLGFNAGTNLTSVDAGSVEYDGNNLYFTPDTSQGRNVVLEAQQFYLSAAGSAIGATIANFFGANSAASLAATSTYDIEAYCYFLKTTAGTATWAPTFSTNATIAHATLEYTPVTGFTTTNISGAMVLAEATQQTVGAMTFAATASLTTAVYHIAKFKIRVTTNTACNFRLNITQSAGTVTPQAGSFYTVRKVVSNAGNFVA